MNRTIIGFHCDPEGDWVADLDCAHGQHMRHTPPFFERPWVLDPIERNARIGTSIQCIKCDQFVWPENLVHVKSTPEFERQTVPSGLLKDHATKAGIWGKVVLQDGQIRYYPEVLDGEALILTPETPGIIVPEMKHYVEPVGNVRFHVEFYRSQTHNQ